MAKVPHAGDDLNELESRQDPRLLLALDMVAPGTPLREGIDNIIHARTGGLILLAEADEVSFLFSRRDQARRRLHARRSSTRWRRWTGRS